MLPIVYHPDYNIIYQDFEHLHAFDTRKYGKIFDLLEREGILDGMNYHVPSEISRKELLRVHTVEYLDRLLESRTIAGIAEISALAHVPAAVLDERLLRPMRLATAGSRLAVELAETHGWAINLSGGYHHAKSNYAHGFCYYADINLAIYDYLTRHPERKVMVLDLDAHQGDGFAAIFEDDPRISIFDIYNQDNFPRDYAAAEYIRYKFNLHPPVDTPSYLRLLHEHLPAALDEAQPDLLVYNAGVDIYEHDQLGGFQVSGAGIVERDDFVMEMARQRNLPVAMLLSGGYHRDSWKFIGQSILHFLPKFAAPGSGGQPV